MKSKIRLLLLAGALIFTGCYDDKGNYEYTQVPQVRIENIPELMELLGNSDRIVVHPRIISDTEGEIRADNPHFTFLHAIERKSGGWLVSGQRWVTLNSSGSLDLDTLASFSPDTYIGLFKATDTRSGIEYFTTYDIRITSPTYEGWLVLCNEGAENRVRMDMISVISSDRIVPAYDLLTPLGLPEIHNATMIGFTPTMYVRGDEIYVLSMDGAYKLNRETFVTNESWKINYVDFALPPSEEVKMCGYYPLYGPSFIDKRAIFGFTTDGNVYCLVGAYAGTGFEYPINTSVRGGAPEFKVAPCAGYSMARPGHGNAALFYDTDNLRFVGWRYGTTEDGRHILSSIPDPETGKLFSFTTGMKLIYMESTRFSEGMVYSILEDNAGKRHVYGINMAGNGFAQEACYSNLNAPDFEKATQFAFHSQFPFMFYAVGNKVYLHNLGTGITYPMNNISLGNTEEVTLLKFNLYVQGGLNYLNNQTEEFMARQYELMVGSYDSASEDNNGGRLGFYPVDGINNTVSKRTEFSGFARIKDVVYRERR